MISHISTEDGIDLEYIYNQNNSKIVIAVKKKPKKKWL